MRKSIFGLWVLVLLIGFTGPEAHAFGRWFRRPKPRPMPMPTPTPTPTLNPRTDLSPSCRKILEGTGIGTFGCQAADNSFDRQLHAARVNVPKSLLRGDGSPYSVPDYADALIDYLDKQFGICGFWDGQSMMLRDAKNTNEYYRITGPNRVNKIFFTTNCTPARKFGARDTDLDPDHPDPTCPLPRSNIDESATCINHKDISPAFAKVVDQAIREVEAEQRLHPSFLHFKPGPGYRVWIEKDKGEVYLARIVERLRAHGVCAMQDGGQGVSVKQGSNDRSDFWALQVLGTTDDQGRHPTRQDFLQGCFPANF